MNLLTLKASAVIYKFSEAYLMFFTFLDMSSTLSTSSTLKDESSSLLLDKVCEIGLNGLGVVGERLHTE